MTTCTRFAPVAILVSGIALNGCDGGGERTSKRTHELPSDGAASGLGIVASAKPRSQDALVVANPASIDFGKHHVGDPKNETVVLRNDGLSPATNLTGSIGARGFAFPHGEFPGPGGTCGETLEPGAKCTVRVRFRAKNSGTYVAKLHISYSSGNAPETRETTVKLNGVVEPRPSPLEGCWRSPFYGCGETFCEGSGADGKPRAATPSFPEYLAATAAGNLTGKS